MRWYIIAIGVLIILYGLFRLIKNHKTREGTLEVILGIFEIIGEILGALV
jgi:hypothetical protein